MRGDHIDLTVDRLINLCDDQPIEDGLAWSRRRQALMIVLDELLDSAPQHPATLRIQNFIRRQDYFFFDGRH